MHRFLKIDSNTLKLDIKFPIQNKVKKTMLLASINFILSIKQFGRWLI